MIVFTIIGYAVCLYLSFQLGWYSAFAWDVFFKTVLANNAVEDAMRAIVAWTEVRHQQEAA